jgi:hypothetical protein
MREVVLCAALAKTRPLRRILYRAYIKKAPCLATGRSLLLYLFPAYQVLDPWHPGEPQVLVVALKFKLLTTLFTPFKCVAEFTAVVL